MMASLDWSQGPEVGSIPGKVSGAWLFKGSRLPISVVFENLEYGSSIEEIVESYTVRREQIQVVLEFATRMPRHRSVSLTDAHSTKAAHIK